MKEDAKPSKDSEDAFYNSQKFEVLYCGKVTVTHKKAPSSLIDDCIEKFSLHEQQRLRTQSETRYPDARSDPVVFEVEGPSSPSDILLEEEDGVTNTHPVFPAVVSQPGLSSSRCSFPERILEDSGFDEQQEFRSRCSSVTGVLQRKVHENSQKPQPRRRHASAPSHVQPSDSEKNRTMLFQVLPWQGLSDLSPSIARPKQPGVRLLPLPHSAIIPLLFLPLWEADKADGEGAKERRKGLTGRHGMWIVRNEGPGQGAMEKKSS